MRSHAILSHTCGVPCLPIPYMLRPKPSHPIHVSSHAFLPHTGGVPCLPSHTCSAHTFLSHNEYCIPYLAITCIHVAHIPSYHICTCSAHPFLSHVLYTCSAHHFLSHVYTCIAHPFLSHNECCIPYSPVRSSSTVCASTKLLQRW